MPEAAETPPPDAGSPFRTWRDVEPHPFRQGVLIHAVGGEQVLLVRVRYEPGVGVERHSHEAVEQVMAIVEGDLTITVDRETRRLQAGDVIVINRGLEHELSTDGGCVFFEALAPVPLDHVPNRERDLVLGPDGGLTHVER